MVHGGDDEDLGQKVVQLFPDYTGDVARGLERRPGLDWDDVDAVEREIQGVLRQARPAESAEEKDERGPAPSHRNAIRCPQCDRFTWRRTQVCMHCGADLAAYAAERRQAVFWCAAIASWVIALGCFYVMQHYALTPRMHTLLNLVGLGIVGVNVFGFWLASQGEKR